MLQQVRMLILVGYVLLVVLMIVVASPIVHAQCLSYVPADTTNALTAISFADSLHGVAVGGVEFQSPPRSALYTKDGGITWKRGERWGTRLQGVEMIDTSFACAVGFGGFIIKTTNGGATWTEKQGWAYPNYGFSGVSFYNSQLGITVGRYSASPGWPASALHSIVLKSTDAGEHWSRISAIPRRQVHDVAILDSLTVIAASDSGILRSSDGGITWQSSIQNSIATLYSLSFVDRFRGWAAGSGLVMRTTDGGITWMATLVFSNNQPTDVSFQDSLHGMKVEGSALSYTVDGGVTWTVSNYPHLTFKGIQYASPGRAYAVGHVTSPWPFDGSVFVFRQNEACPSRDVSSLFPPMNALSVGLHQNPLAPRSLRFEWSFPPTADITQSRFQLSMDSSFTGDVVADALIPVNGSMLNRSFVVSNLRSKTTYYWRIALKLMDGTFTNWSESWRFVTAGGAIDGSAFVDINRDGIQNQSEPRLTGMAVDIFGDARATVYTDAAGAFSFGGLDSGQYLLQLQSQLPALWASSVPKGGSYTVVLGRDDTSSGNIFGRFFPWNSVHGTVFEDLNENGVQDTDEPGLAQWAVRVSGDANDSVLTDENGNYQFLQLPLGTMTFTSVVQSSWEQINPQRGAERTSIFYSYNQVQTGSDFSMHRISKRVKLSLFVKDSTSFARRDIWWGIRSGTTFGIWGADPMASRADFSEGEFEIPPQTFGFFDARFIAPRPSWQFGYGGWTDMRDFRAVAQVDTYKVSFRPGYFFGGDYPFTLTWSSDAVALSYNGQVSLVDRYGNVTDMKANQSLLVNDQSINSLLLITNGPNIPASYLQQWRLISLPRDVPDARRSLLFPSASSRAFSFSPSMGYQARDTLQTRNGYWLRYSSALDSLRWTMGTVRSLDTVNVESGWNLIGTLSVPVDVSTIQSTPTGLVVGSFFGYGGTYAPQDSLEPGQGYWVKCSQAGKLILSSGSEELRPVKVSMAERLSGMNRLIVRDAAGHEQILYFGRTDSANDGSLYELPPVPPDGAFDVRFSSNTMLELVGEGVPRECPLVLSSVSYPVTIRWEKNIHGLRVRLSIDGRDVEMANDGSVEVHQATLSLVLKLAITSIIPKEFALDQNYPNPFNPATTISYQLPFDSRVKLRIYNVLGQEVQLLVDQVQEAGYKSVEWNARQSDDGQGTASASGIYFYRLDATNLAGHDKSFTHVRKMVLLK